MKLALAQLKPHLTKQGLQPFYLLNGEDPYLIQLALDSFSETTGAQIEKQRLTLQTAQMWDELFITLQSPSLFSPQRLFILSLPSLKLAAAVQTQLQTWLKKPPINDYLIFCVGQLNAKDKQVAWLKGLLTQAIEVECLAPTAQQYPTWLKQQLSQRGLQTDAEGITLMAHYFADNPGAALQEMDKLTAYLQGETRVTGATLRDILTAQGQFSVYQMLDYCFAGDLKQTLAIYHQLMQDESQALLITWMLAKELRLLLTLAFALEKGEKLASLSQKYRLWPQKLNLYQKVLARHNYIKLWSLLAELAKADQRNKGYGQQDSYQLLMQILQQLGTDIN